MQDAVPTVTELLAEMRNGNPEAESRLVPLVYDDLRQVARRLLSHESPGQTLQTTALVHEAYLRLAGGHRDWKDRAHFFAVAAQAMRRILVDHARSRGRLKRGGDWERVPLEVALDVGEDAGIPILLALDEA